LHGILEAGDVVEVGVDQAHALWDELGEASA